MRKKAFMSEMGSTSIGMLDPLQASELAMLVDLEAHWENLRKTPSRDSDGKLTLPDLLCIQKAYEAFRGRMVKYNKLYKPAHESELLLNNPSRLGSWCRAMRNLYLQVEHDTKVRCPVHLLEKAYRCADRVGFLMKKGSVSRTTPLTTIRDAVGGLEALAQWCDELASAAATV
jgi:hypothetical protein